MASGNNIVVKSAFGRKEECIISGTPKPGVVMQLQAGTAAVNGKFTYEAYNPAGGDNGPIDSIPAILDFDGLQGRIATTAYASGERGFLWFPALGDEFNMLLKNITGTGTGDEVGIAEPLIPDAGTGKMIKRIGSDESPNPADLKAVPLFNALEVETDVSADVLIHCMFCGIG